ncbi:MAG: hypothetical protein Q7R98_01480 [Candidatus Jorgensenbacteria bacterium]|nr:hypothetical protein [Candidatus Jorgensenbacteria bacterium]
MKKLLLVISIAMFVVFFIGGCGTTYEIRTSDIEYMVVRRGPMFLAGVKIRNMTRHPVIIDPGTLQGVELSPPTEVMAGEYFTIVARGWMRNMTNGYHSTTITAVPNGVPAGKIIRSASRQWSFNEGSSGTNDESWVLESNGGSAEEWFQFR